MSRRSTNRIKKPPGCVGWEDYRSQPEKFVIPPP